MSGLNKRLVDELSGLGSNAHELAGFAVDQRRAIARLISLSPDLKVSPHEFAGTLYAIYHWADSIAQTANLIAMMADEEGGAA